MMLLLINVLLCGFAAAAVEEVELQADRPYLKALSGGSAQLECCYRSAKQLQATWVKIVQTNLSMTVLELNSSDLSTGVKMEGGIICHSLELTSLVPSDSNLYWCWLKEAKVFSHGTYLHVSKWRVKIFNLSENTKNQILKAEGILLLLFVVLPTTLTLLQKKKLNELEKKKVTKDNENIYQGLNLDDCCPKYDQIERSHCHDQYQDVCSNSEEEVYQLEKP